MSNAIGNATGALGSVKIGATGVFQTPYTDSPYGFRVNARDLVPSIGPGGMGGENGAKPTELRSLAPMQQPVPGNIHGSGRTHTLPTRSEFWELQQTAFHFVTVLRDVLSSKKTNMLKFCAPLIMLAPGQTMFTTAQIYIDSAEYDETTELVPPQTFGMRFESQSQSVKMYNLGFHQEHLFKLGGNLATDINRMLIENLHVAMLNTLVYRACDMLMMQPVYMQAKINLEEPQVLARRAKMLDFVFIASRDNLGMMHLYREARNYFTKVGIPESVPMWIMTVAGAIEQTMLKDREWMFRRGYFELPVPPGATASGPVEAAVAYLLSTPGTIPFLGDLNAAVFTVEPMTLAIDNRAQSQYHAQMDTAKPFEGPYSIGEVYIWEGVRERMNADNPVESPLADLYVSIFSRPTIDMHTITLHDACDRFCEDLVASPTAFAGLKKFLKEYKKLYENELLRIHARFNERYADDNVGGKVDIDGFNAKSLNEQFEYLTNDDADAKTMCKYIRAAMRGHVIPYFLPIVYRPALTLQSTTIATGVSGGTHDTTSMVCVMGDSETAVGADAHRFLNVHHHRFTGGIFPLQNRLISVFPAAIAGGYRRGGGHLPINIDDAAKIMGTSHEEAREAFDEDRSVWFVPYPLTHLLGEAATAFPYISSGVAPQYLGLNGGDMMKMCPFAPYTTAFTPGDAGDQGDANTRAIDVVHGGLGTWVVPGYCETGYLANGERKNVRVRNGVGPCAGYNPMTYNRWEDGVAHDPLTTRSFSTTIKK